jgi:hypothetical protein
MKTALKPLELSINSFDLITWHCVMWSRISLSVPFHVVARTTYVIIRVGLFDASIESTV